MSARQSFVPRSASRASTRVDTEHPFDMSLRDQNSSGQPQRTGGIQGKLDSMQSKTDSEKRACFAEMLGKHKLAGKPGSEDHQAAIDASFSSAYGRFSGIYRPNFSGDARGTLSYLPDVNELIVHRKYETSTSHHVLQGFSTSGCDWLMLPGEGARKQHRVSDGFSQTSRNS
ncbi:uncharacterized protein BJ212DRAFT_708837 [Suillus subaureus]|uniref:Uncharacterized protein n=1 Tax=Suillus subaureus TaxID=48587 RepID=A0A9P7EK03_9AGAM|nr:uncharacterized protein BJ212DRAFT_708837 [Suillus subaureus]KAG1823922.1 hypothetical protein BJ212DRAFT_708837 [Suillus subaureus]